MVKLSVLSLLSRLLNQTRNTGWKQFVFLSVLSLLSRLLNREPLGDKILQLLTLFQCSLC